MEMAIRSPDETRRLDSLHALRLLDTEAEPRFDRITRLAQRLFDTPMAAVSLIDADRQWYKSEVGLGRKEGPRDASFCTHAIAGDGGPLVVEDARLDPRFADNPAVLGGPKVRFYAGQPVTAPDGEAVGTLCVTDDKPRVGADFDVDTLVELAGMVEAEIASFELSIGDGLTGLSNRRGFELLGARLIELAARRDLPASAVYVDLDDLKPINDRFGHEAGDRALIAAGSVLADSLRGSDLIARIGGDEFCAVLVGNAAAAAPGLAGRVEEQIAAHNAASAEPFEISLTVGTGEAGAGEETRLWDLVARADAAMLAAKRAKKSDRAGRVAA